MLVRPGPGRDGTTVMLSRPDCLQLSERLLDWYATNRRDLPWRRTTDPYRIWVSEIMLQQTQVATVIPYYERFLRRFPTVVALAEAKRDEVLALWQGLGYYSRGRNLHAAARVVRDAHGGRVPDDPASLRALPGVGAYTAGAILSIAFDQDVPAIDGNVVRVLCRLFDYDRSPKTAAGKRFLADQSACLLPPGHARAYNQAMMELGATVCLPRSPSCATCPLGGACRAHALGVEEQRPVRPPRKGVPHQDWVAAVVEQRDGLLIVRRVSKGLLGGLWELPGGEVLSGESDGIALRRLLTQGLGVEAGGAIVGEHLAVVRHAYTHFRLTVRAYRCSLQGELGATGGWDAVIWLGPDDADDYGLTGVTTKLLATIPWAGSGLLL